MANRKDGLFLLLFYGLHALIICLPRRLCLLMGHILGFLFFCFDRRHRSIALSNLKSALGKNTSDAALKRIARNSFLHFGEILFDIIKFTHLREEKKNKLITVEGEEFIQEVLKEGKGALLFSAHFGNWEIAPFLLSRMGKLSVVARPLDNRFLENQLLKLRTKLGAKVIYKHQASRQILRLLRANEMVAILIDQNVLWDQAVFIHFFGKLAATTPSLATFYLRTGSPLLPVFCFPTPLHGYHIKISEPLKISLTGDNNLDVLKITQLCTKIIEEQIRENPKYWLWFHNRWKTRPEEALSHKRVETFETEQR